MLSPKTQYNLKNAKSYFEEHLCVGDYYSEGERVMGEWFGNGSQLLGLAGNVGADQFLKLCDNLHPLTGENLTIRQKTTRNEMHESGREREVANRRVFYDFTLSPPKSVSIAALVGDDERITGAHERATRVALGELEKFAGTRVRIGGKMEDRSTGNIVAAVFRHETSRALDPHLHSHCILFNATFDGSEHRWKALQNYELLQARKYVENVYYHELARNLRQFGYAIENHARGDFEIRGVSRKLCDVFSKRHREIDQRTRDLLAREPRLTAANLADVRENIARNERSRKMKGVATEKLRGLWSEQISPEDAEAIASLARLAVPGELPITAVDAVAWAEEHLFDRKSVVREDEIWRHALERARGGNLTLKEVHAVTARADYLRDEHDPRRLTTRRVLSREWEIVSLVKERAGSEGRLCATPLASDSGLDEGQRQAVGQILESRDFVTLFRGGAGTGKSFALREVVRALVDDGRSCSVVAPQRQQVQGLVRDGFSNAQTVSELLTRKEMAAGSVLIVDEAGQLGAKQMFELLAFAKQRNARVILSGDTRQHGAVEASDALRAIERYSGVKAAELNEIRRQDPERGESDAERAWIAEYKRAVEKAAAGDAAASFARLDEAGAVIECSLADQHDRLVNEYLGLAAANLSTVVVSQTWSEIHRVNERVRDGLQAQGLIGREEWPVTTLQTVDLTDAQKRDSRFFGDDAALVFNRNAAGFTKGESGSLVAITGKGLVVEAGGKIRTVPFAQLDRVTVCRKHDLALASGDRLQLKANAKTATGERVANGEIVAVVRVEADGRIRLQDGRVLGRDYRQFVRGYAVTSYASQGKTVDCVLFSDSTSKVATNAEQWYVTISRGRRGLKIFTPDKERLRESVTRSGARALALDLKLKQRRERRRLRRLISRGMKQARNFVSAVQRHVAAFTAARRTRAVTQRSGVSVS